MHYEYHASSFHSVLNHSIVNSFRLVSSFFAFPIHDQIAVGVIPGLGGSRALPFGPKNHLNSGEGTLDGRGTQHACMNVHIMINNNVLLSLQCIQEVAKVNAHYISLY